MTRKKQTSGRYSLKTYNGACNDFYIGFVNYINKAVHEEPIAYERLDRATFIGACAEDYILANKEKADSLHFSLDQLLKKYMMESR